MQSTDLSVHCKTFNNRGIGIGYVAKEFPVSLNKLYILGVGDLHADFEGCKRMQEIFDWARANNARVLLTGDMYNFALRNSKSFEYGTEDPALEIDRVNQLIAAYADLIDGAVSGNHDRRSRKDSGEDSLRRVCLSNNISYHPDALVIAYKLGRDMNGNRTNRLCYTVFLTHTLRGGRKEGSKLQKVVDLRDVIIADIYLAGHSHDLTGHKGSIIHVDTRNNSLFQRQILFANCGSEYPYAGYPVEHNLVPSKRGCVRIRLDGRKYDTHVSL